MMSRAAAEERTGHGLCAALGDGQEPATLLRAFNGVVFVEEQAN
jgi:hypothetical protein